MRQFSHVPFLFFVIVNSDFGKHTDMNSLLTEFCITASRQLFNIIFSSCASLQKKKVYCRGFSNSFLLKITSYGSLLNICLFQIVICHIIVWDGVNFLLMGSHFYLSDSLPPSHLGCLVLRHLQG